MDLLEKKPKEILDLEKIYGIKLKKVEEDKFDFQTHNIYAVNKNNEVTHLSLYENQIAEIRGLEQFVGLKVLTLSRNCINKIKGLDSLINLDKLYLYENRLEKIENLEKLTNLRTLFLSSNKIKEISGLDKLVNLIGLGLSENQLTEIKGLENLENLHTLFLYNNQITEINGLRKLKKLTSVYLYSNQIRELPEWIIDFNIKNFNLDYNPLENPPLTTVEQGNYAIKCYFERIKTEDSLSFMKPN